MKYKSIVLIMIFLISMTGVMGVGANIDTLPVHWVGFDAAVLAGNLTTLGTHTNGTAFFQYKVVGATNWTNTTDIEFMTAANETLLNAFDLIQDTNYTYRALFLTDDDTLITSIIEENFTTNKSPLIEYVVTTNMTNESLSFNLNLTSLGDEDNVSVYMECYEYYGDGFLTTNETAQIINETGVVTTNITGLEAETTYLCYGVVDFDFAWSTFQIYTEGVEITTESNPELEETYETGILGIQTITFAAFALLAVMLLTAIAMLLITTIQKGADINQLMAMGIYVIGGAIVLFVGYLIIASVANGLI